jgi:hypothetical protein
MTHDLIPLSNYCRFATKLYITRIFDRYKKWWKVKRRQMRIMYGAIDRQADRQKETEKDRQADRQCGRQGAASHARR